VRYFLLCIFLAFSLEAQVSLKEMKKESRVAFVIVNDAYKGLKKNSEIYGKNKINDFLKSSGFETIYLRNATRNEMIKVLRTYRDALTTESVALFYYSGHTVQIKGKNYLLPVDTINDKKDAVKMKIELQAILNVMSRFTSRKNMVLIDNIENAKIRKKFNVKKKGLAEVSVPKNSDVVITSKVNSISSFLTKSNLSKEVSNKQRSEGFKNFDSSAYVKLSDNPFYFSVPSTLKPAKKKISKEDSLWKDAVKNNNIKAYYAYLAGYPAGKYSTMAKSNIEGIENKILAKKKIELALREKKQQELEKQERERQILADKLKAQKKVPSFIEPKMIEIKPGSFKMGCSTCENHNERPLHFVSIKNAFSMGKYEVSNAEYNLYLVSIKKPKNSADDKLPAVNVSWQDALDYAKWLSEKTGKNYTLPSESQWEYASRADTKTKYFWGNQGSKFEAYAWGKENSGLQLHKVGEKEANQWGLYDLHGNVSEWCADDYRLDYTQKSRNDGNKVLRGGSYLSEVQDLRASLRYFKPSSFKSNDIGFRLVLN
jgi:formylglycine-generating enzyme required for sulfatase activity